MFGPLVSTSWLHVHLDDPDLVIADVRWYSDDRNRGRAAFTASHIPGALFLDTDTELSDQSDPMRGRHPLPDPRVFVSTLAKHGIGKNTKVVAYDDKGGSIAARLWWMLRWLGSENGAVLDGGIPRWIYDGYPVESGIGKARLSAVDPFEPNVRNELAADRAAIESRAMNEVVLVDVRAPERFRGEVEPIDFRAGHIPGAINVPYAENLTVEDAPIFKSPAELKATFKGRGIESDSDVICYCGSGVTACHSILAMEFSGLTRTRLYAGSWSEWIHYH